MFVWLLLCFGDLVGFGFEFLFVVVVICVFGYCFVLGGGY